MIDWFTVGAQVFNFLILVALLKKFLYGPITRAMDERRQRLEEEQAEAKETRDKAEKKHEHYQQLLDQIQAEKDEQLKRAEKEAEEKRKELLDRFREEADQQRRGWVSALDREKDQFLKEIGLEAGRLVTRTAGRVLSELADSRLESQAAAALADRLDELDDESKQKLKQSLREAEGRAVIESAFELSEEDVKKISRSLEDLSGHEVSLDESTNESLILGPTLRAGDYKIPWSAKDLLAEIQNRLEKMVDDKTASPDNGAGRDEADGAGDDGGQAEDQAGDDRPGERA